MAMMMRVALRGQQLLKVANGSALRCLAAAPSSSAAAHKGHSHSGLWSAERAVSAGLLAVIPAAFLAPKLPGIDYALALALVSHVHWGVEAIVVDYIRPSIFGEVAPKVMLGLVYALSALALGGLFYFNYTDVGVTQGIKMAWKQL